MHDILIKKGIHGPVSSVLIPKRPKEGCPENTYGCVGNDCNALQSQTCFCEEHCSWAICRLDDPKSSDLSNEEHCLREVKGRWVWDPQQLYWVAQILGMIAVTVSKFWMLSVIVGIPGNTIERFPFILSDHNTDDLDNNEDGERQGTDCKKSISTGIDTSSQKEPVNYDCKDHGRLGM